MASPVSNSISNPAAANVAFNASASHSGAGTFSASFPDLLRGQMQTSIDARRPSPTSPPPSAVDAAHTRQADRAPSHEPSHTPAPASTPPARQGPAREPRPAGGKAQEATTATTAESPETTMPDDEACETSNAPDGTAPDDVAPDGAVPENAAPILAEAPIQAVDAVITPILSATIAAPPKELADANADNASDATALEDSGAETPPRNAKQARRAAIAASMGGAHLAGHGTAAKAADSAAAAAAPTAASSNTAAASAGSQAANLPGLRADISAARADMAAQAAMADADAPPVPMPNALRTSAQESAAPLRFAIPAAAGQRAWAEEAGNKIMWMLGRAETRAELILTPPHLGKVEVSINLSGEQTTAQFIASSQAARDALEQAMPRLRELLAQAGIDLGNANVDTSAEGRTRDDAPAHTASRGNRSGSGHDDGSNDDATGVTSANWARRDNGLINTFA